MTAENYINHIGLVLDASASMRHLEGQVTKVADNQIAYLAQRSKDLDQETRVTVYSFSDPRNIRCLIYDKDVLRMPSIGGLYRTDGNTALVDATLLCIGDLKLSPEKYGEHAFLIYVLTDGQENSSQHFPSDLAREIAGLPDHWTLATFVPDMDGVFEAKKFGFPAANIAVWDATTTKGVSEAGERIRQTTEDFMQNRTQGIRGSRNLFTLRTPDAKDIAQQLPYLGPGQYRIIPVMSTDSISSFVEANLKRPYKLGEAYYQLTKPEEIQPQKSVAIFDKSKVYFGVGARQLLGLPDYTVKVAPASYPGYDIFVQSTSVNRKLVPGTHVLIRS